MGYRDKNGIVGQYRGTDVYIIAYKDLTESMTKSSDTIYAVRCNNNDNLELVQRGRLIGTMTDSGHVELWDSSRRRNYRCYKAPGLSEQPIKKVEWSIKEAPEPDLSQALNVEFGYGAYSKTVDNFFKGLDKLWAEIDASIDA